MTQPTYDRSKLSAGIVHIGVGNFHRAHQAWYLHRLMEMGLDHDWAIIGSGVRPEDEVMRKKLAAQDYLTTLIELSPDNCSTEVIGSMIGFVPVEADNQALIEQLTNPAIRIVSTTVTEGGYFINLATRDFDETNADIRYDAANPETPRTAFGAIVAALRHRRDSGAGPLSCQSCDNLPTNGHILRQTIVSLARMSDPDLARWIDDTCSFPNSMVDSIVPATLPTEHVLAKELGICDTPLVTHENFRQWVIEDEFCAGRPEWEKAGATFSNNVHSYEIMKIRILNGGHQIIAATGDLLGIETISEAMANPLIGGLFDKAERKEIMPHIQAVPDYSPEAYVRLIDQRFRNPAIIDTTRRVAFDGSSRQSGFILPSIEDCLSRGIRPDGLALVSAIWARYCLGRREDGSIIAPNDPHWHDLAKWADEARNDSNVWLTNNPAYGNIRYNHNFATLFRKWHSLVLGQGVCEALRIYLAEG